MLNNLTFPPSCRFGIHPLQSSPSRLVKGTAPRQAYQDFHRSGQRPPYPTSYRPVLMTGSPFAAKNPLNKECPRHLTADSAIGEREEAPFFALASRQPMSLKKVGSRRCDHFDGQPPIDGIGILASKSALCWAARLGTRYRARRNARLPGQARSHRYSGRISEWPCAPARSFSKR